MDLGRLLEEVLDCATCRQDPILSLDDRNVSEVEVAPRLAVRMLSASLLPIAGRVDSADRDEQLIEARRTAGGVRRQGQVHQRPQETGGQRSMYRAGT
jgi:hypothetical protein